MELIPVLDLARGVAVHAIGGERSRYAPVQSVLVPGRDGDAMALARAYRAWPTVERCYVADLDAIGGAPAQLDLLVRLQSSEGFGGPLLLDAGVASLDELERLGGAFGHVVVGLESLSSFTKLTRLAAQVDVTFSLDLRNDLPITRMELLAEAGSVDAVALARAAVEAGARSLILLDVGRVGRGVGVNLELLASLRRALPQVVLLAGGGVRDDADISMLAGSGCDGVLVATALHRGTLTAPVAPPGQPGASEVR
jgi:phosphoribosylformimino-5-aminoimidazole carboxamide ribotide isomerase